jgi:putative hydrolase of the HAD superfamily
LHRDFQRGRVTSTNYLKELNRRFGGNVTEAQFLQQADYPTLLGEVYDMAASLREHGIVTAIFSNIPQANAHDLRKRGCYKGFDPVILSCEEGYAKPDAEFYQVAVRKLDVRPEEVLLIDDQEQCLSPARKMGMHTILANTPQQIAADTRALIARENNLSV